MLLILVHILLTFISGFPESATGPLKMRPVRKPGFPLSFIGRALSPLSAALIALTRDFGRGERRESLSRAPLTFVEISGKERGQFVVLSYFMMKRLTAITAPAGVFDQALVGAACPAVGLAKAEASACWHLAWPSRFQQAG